MELFPPSLDLLRPAKKVSLLASIVPDFHDTKKAFVLPDVNSDVNRPVSLGDI